MIDGNKIEYVDLENTVKEISVILKNDDSFGHYNVNSVGFVKIFEKVFLRIDWETKGMYDFKMIELDNIKHYHIVIDKENQCNVYNLKNGHITQNEFEEAETKRIAKLRERKTIEE
jgi:hypothetical protein